MSTFTMSNQVRWIGWFLVTISIIASVLLRLNVNIHPLLSLADALIAVVVLFLARLFLVGSDRGSETGFDALRRDAPTDPTAGRSSTEKWSRQLAIARNASLLVVAFPFMSAAYQRWLGWTGEAWEIIVVVTIQYLALWFVTWRSETKYQWMGILLSSFMFLFCFVMADQIRMQGLLLVYAILGTWWLMSAHWARVERGFIETRSTSMIPLRVGLLTSITLLSAVTAWAIVPRDWIVRTLEGFMPTSGGQIYADAAARSGVGDGELLLPAVNDTSIFGPVESEIFLESQQPSLYDVVSELYGEPKGKKRKKQDRAISLAGTSDKPADEGRESQEGSREFSTVRDPKGLRMKNQRAERNKALMLVDARLGHHWKMGSYEYFDGVTWRSPDAPSASLTPAPSLEHHFGKPWIRIDWKTQPLFHSLPRVGDIRIINLRSPRLPTPIGLTHVHIDRVDRPDFFGLDPGDRQVIMVDREYIPQLTTIHLAQQQPNLHLLRYDQRAPYRRPPESLGSASSSVDKLVAVAKAWTADASNDWQRVEQIVQRLRTEFTVDRAASAPDDCEDVVNYFLETKRGPDYMFATTAAILLRVIGIETRFVTGFYARDEKYDPKTRHTQVDVGDMHCWVETKFQGEWIGIEPTPGYRPPIEYRTWAQWAWQLGYDAVRWTMRHPVQVFVSVFAVVLMWQSRLLLYSLSWILGCWSLSHLSLHAHRWSLRMLLGISRLHRTRKRPDETIAEWMRRDWQLAFSRQLAGTVPQLMVEAYEHETFAPQHLAEEWKHRHNHLLKQVRKPATKIALERVFASSPIRQFIIPFAKWLKAFASRPQQSKAPMETYQANL